MPDDPLAHVVAALEAERDALHARLAGLAEDMAGFFEASRDSNADDEHDPEGQTIAFERAQLSAVTEQTRRHLAEVEEALARVADGSYGRCEVCGRPIPPARLEVRPMARTCVEHAPGRR
ncbi:TraR/DksA C4-type zinc finger protein [Ornithinimicrobium humiphilum]|uniref:TraR/DksA family transcriptional regulator n=1 Tax=Ornithinimicrobium humiphilum TaxID=125288 RepID=A0A543K813_9MICO|nr:TraR/DksA C4-type zinc finger protein [Ornithinimicrobium humiphilum]TQM91229.1 TraR/DksA family transcriptional regulator [Ornithinimicrobium humiphilum]